MDESRARSLDVLRSVRHVTGKTSLLQPQQTSHTTSCRLGQRQCGKASSQDEYSESKTPVQALLPIGRLAKIACGSATTSFGHGSQCRTISKVKNDHHSFGKEQDSTMGNSLTVIGIFVSKRVIPLARLHSAASGADDYG